MTQVHADGIEEFLGLSKTEVEPSRAASFSPSPASPPKPATRTYTTPPKKDEFLRAHPKVLILCLLTIFRNTANEYFPKNLVKNSREVRELLKNTKDTIKKLTLTLHSDGFGGVESDYEMMQHIVENENEYIKFLKERHSNDNYISNLVKIVDVIDINKFFIPAVGGGGQL